VNVGGQSVRPIALRRIGFAWLAFAIFFLAGCATQKNVSAPFDIKKEAARTFWGGRLALQVEGSDVQSFAASFELRGTAKQGELRLFTPLGSTVAVVEWNAWGATLNSGAGIQRFASLDALATSASGNPIPVAALFDWLRGEPSAVPGWEPDLRLLANGRLIARRTDPLPAMTLRVVLDQ
jgi:outer membrane lipoprotein LolB